MSTIICGDLHGCWSRLNELLNKKRSITTVLQCGDFGYWPKFDGQLDKDTKTIWEQCGIKNPRTKIYFCDGNHEDHSELTKLSNSTEVCKNVFYMPRGSVLELGYRNILFMGGADSIDKNLRTPGLDWFPEETISQRNILNLPEIRIDIVISHAAPIEFELEGIGDKKGEPSRRALSEVLYKYRPIKWFFGHYHLHRRGIYDQCEWTALNMEGEHGWWVWLR